MKSQILKLHNLLEQALSEDQVKNILDTRHYITLLLVEAGSEGFDKNTGKLKIQFEPGRFAAITRLPRVGLWAENKVDVQSKEWLAFSDAFRIDPQAAMKATSIGLPQILGENHSLCGYDTVDAMWDDFKAGELNQAKALIRFLDHPQNKGLKNSLFIQNWDGVAKGYNGKGYKALALKLKTKPYDEKLRDMFKLVSSVLSEVKK